MSVQNVSASGASSIWQRREQDFESLVSTSSSSSNKKDSFRSAFAQILSAVSSGDISAAQQALTGLQGGQSATYSPASTTATTSTSTSSGSPVQNDMRALIAAVNSGDTSGAQKALTQLQNDMKAHAHGGHHHHHHSGKPTAPAAPATDPANPTGVASGTPASSGGDADNDGDSK